MQAPETKADLLRALGRLARGLSALFWGLPLALVVGIQTARTDWLRPMGIFPPLLANGLLLYGLFQMAGFHPQERPWRVAMDWAKCLAVINLGLSPFLFWWHYLPEHSLFLFMVTILAVNGFLFLYALNVVLQRLAAMLPDETLRYETHFFSSMNRYLVLITVGLLAAYGIALYLDPMPQLFALALRFLDSLHLGLLILLVLLPISITMALLWKIKEVILAGVFSSQA
jgi:hypothetical protein